MIEAIVAMASNRVIGRNNELPWRFSADLKRFKAITMGQVLLMGRKTYESIGRPLPGRTTWVLTHQSGWNAPEVVTIPNLESAQDRARAETRRVIVAGGEAIYRLMLPHVTRLYLTQIDRPIEGDARFPEVDLSSWKCVEDDPRYDDALNCGYRFQTWER